jgi:fructokinase
VIVVCGEALVDLAIAVDGSLRARLGGGPFNVSRTAARLGAASAYLGRISVDRFGVELLAALVADGVETATVVPTDDPTTLAVAEVDASGAASYHFYLDGTSARGLTPAEALERLPPDISCLHVGTLALVLEPIASAVDALLAAAPNDAVVMVDPNCRPAVADRGVWRRALDRVVGRADVVKASTDDLCFLADDGNSLAAARRLLDQGPRLVLLSAGAGGVTLVSVRGQVHIDAPSVRVVDTIGAGDALGGAFLAYWQRAGLGREDLADLVAVDAAAREAVVAAALTCERAGADPPTLAEVVQTLARLDNQPER